MKSCIISFLFVFIFLFSCNSRNKISAIKETHKFQNLVSFKKLDSIKIEYLGNPTVHDLDPISKRIIIIDHKESSEDIHIADFEGNFLASFSKFGNKPDTYGKLMSTIKIIDENFILAYGYKGFLTYDFKGNLQSLVKYDDFQTPSQIMLRMGYGFENFDNFYLYINQIQPPEDLKLLGEFYLLNLIDIKTGKIEPIIQFPENSIFRSGKYFFMRSYFPVFTLEENRIYVVFGSEPVIYVYETVNPYSLISSIPLNLMDYSIFKGAKEQNDEKLFGMSMISGRIDNIKKLENFFLISYLPGFDELDTETNFENKTPEEAKIFRERMKQKYPSRIAIVDTLGTVLSDFVPEGLEPSSMLIRNGEIWMLEKTDEEIERDYFRLFRVGLKIENE
jgi:hypothetical protein